MLARGSFDAIADLAEAYPLSVFPDAMGLKQEGRENLLPYASLVFNAFGPPNELRKEAIERSAPHQAYVAEQCQRENLAPGGFGACIHDRVDAGEITASGGAAAGAFAALGRHRYHRQRHRRRRLLPGALPRTVREDCAPIRSLARNAFEEAVRFESPVQTFFRTTTREVEIGGHVIGEGEKVLMFLGRRQPRSAPLGECRQLRHHPPHLRPCRLRLRHPHVRRPARRPPRRRGDDGGAGAQGRQSIEITGEVKRRYNNTLRGLESLPITIQAAYSTQSTKFEGKKS